MDLVVDMTHVLQSLPISGELRVCAVFATALIALGGMVAILDRAVLVVGRALNVYERCLVLRDRQGQVADPYCGDGGLLINPPYLVCPQYDDANEVKLRDQLDDILRRLDAIEHRNGHTDGAGSCRS